MPTIIGKFRGKIGTKEFSFVVLIKDKGKVANLAKEHGVEMEDVPSGMFIRTAKGVSFSKLGKIRINVNGDSDSVDKFILELGSLEVTD